MAGQAAEISWLDYHPAGRKLDVEIFPFSELQRRTTPEQIRGASRYAFHLLVCVTEGTPTQLVDFEPVNCTPGSLLVIRPGQVHSFGPDESWSGWIVPFRSEFLPSSAETASELIPVLGLDRLPDHLALPAPELHAVTEAMARMQADTSDPAPSKELHALLRYQLSSLLLRLSIYHDRQSSDEDVGRRDLDRFVRFRELVEQNHAGWHQVTQYASALGCTEKSLTRSTLAATGLNAKEFIAARVTLEAKRLLAHTVRPIYLIAEGLGFDEATNFSKFFRREVGCSPVEFRRRHGALNAT
jgi:AraC-like DNA-binding protein